MERITNNNYKKISQTHVKKFNNLKIRKPIYNLIKNDNVNKWVVNLSDRILTDEESSLLSLDPKFIITPNKLTLNTIIASFETYLNKLKLNEILINEIRNKCAHVLSNNYPKNFNLTYEQSKTLQKFYSDKSIIVTKADKGNVSVIMNYNDYKLKVFEIVNNDRIYQKINKDITYSLENKIIKLLKFYKTEKFIDYNTYCELRPKNSKCPSAYALLKMHKKNMPIRLIVPYKTNPFQPLSIYLSKILNPYAKFNNYSIKNSFDFVEKIKNIKLSNK